MKHTIDRERGDEDDKAKLAYALTKSLPAHDAWEMIGSMFDVSKAQAQSLINKGRRLASRDVSEKAS